MSQYASTTGTSSPQPSIRSAIADELNGEQLINLQIFVPELQLQKCLTVPLDELVWDVKRKLFASLPQALQQSFNFGLFLPPCDGRAGKPIRDYPFHDCVPYLELKYKKRVYKMLKLDEKALKQLHSKSNLKKFVEYVVNRNSEKVDKWCAQGLDPNFHDSQGETPLTLAAGIPKNRDVLISLVGGGAHLDFRNSEGQTGMHKAAFLSIADNVKTLLELSASPSYRDPIGLTPLYYCMLTTDSQESVAQMLLSEGSEIGVTDMHGNHEIHQACKNGLLKHVENLLYYGAEINAQNINGNTPLHVCAVNNRPDCARVLLFRGADPFIMNKQGQTALHVAHIVNNNIVADIIQAHNPLNAVPYRGTPKYSTRRRLGGSQILRRRSLSQSSICSAQSDRCYQTPQQLRHSASVAPSPSIISRASTSNQSEYGGTLRRYPPEAVQQQIAGVETNIPRILVIPRGPKGFGFILRGTKHVDSQLDFLPSSNIPALQFFEGVDMSGMAMKAGLRPGDYLLEINGVDVRCSNHEQVVQLIHQSQDTITLKVITVETNGSNAQPHYATTAGTLPSRRNQSVHALPPMPPQRDPRTSLSSYGHHTMGYSTDNSNDNNFVYHPSGSQRLIAAKSSESLSVQSIDSSNYSDQNRCASVKSRPTARRISAAELEHLMIRQSTSQFQPMAPVVYDHDVYDVGQGGARKFTSVADMKRRKQRGGVPSPCLSGLPRSVTNDEVNGQTYENEMQQMKSFNSSPDLQSPIYDQTNGSTFQVNGQKSLTEFSDYSRPCRESPKSNPGILRPKTPPPPIPMINSDMPVMTKSVQSRSTSSVPSTSSAPPPPPPPLPANFLSASAKSTTSNNQNPTSQPSTMQQSATNKSDCRGISAEALCSVQLKPVNNNTLKTQSKPVVPIMPASAPTVPPKVPLKKSLDFDTDLRSALAKRRSKLVTVDDDSNNGETANSSDDGANQQSNSQNGTTQRPYGGLSLRESIRENVQTSVKMPQKSQHSPPGFANKKDSGYTSSRTSLEPSEFGDDQTATPTVTTPTASPIRIGVQTMENRIQNSQFVLGPSTRVTLISQQLEDTFIAPASCKPQYNDTISISSTTSNISSFSTAAANVELSGRMNSEHVRTPPVDYDQDDPDSGTADSDHDSFATSATPSAISNDSGMHSNHTAYDRDEHQQKEVVDWSLSDVLGWLSNLGLSEYVPLFSSNGVVGSELARFDRARFTSLGVTRISHRVAMEQSLREHVARYN
ncbi:hypothetical protein M3Y98_00340500 [Aphelenchoides besseyi]|nr:hypothetical protein M3Y98_00340500 [Aphelenchoides besseyi]KAI6194424.1 hypothetical protein M3Y96_01123100 [Aphelenchoides besseyi]